MKDLEKKFSWVVYVGSEGEKSNDKGEVLAADGKAKKVEKSLTVKVPETDEDVVTLYPKEADRVALLYRAHLIQVRTDATPPECIKPSTNPQAQKERATGKAIETLMSAWKEEDRLACTAALAQGDVGVASMIFAKYAPKRK